MKPCKYGSLNFATNSFHLPTMGMLLRYVVACFLLLVLCMNPKYANGNLIIAPEDREVMVGQSTYFNCSTSTHEMNVNWYFYAVGATGLGRKHVYAGKLYPPYDSKVRIDNSAMGVWNLVIRSASLEDAGRYACEDQGGTFEQKTAELIVLAASPACDSNIELKSVVGPNSCGIEPDMLTLTCSITYNGSISPIMEWKSSSNNDSLSQYVTSKKVGNIATYNLTMKANLQMNGNFFFCETTKSTSSQYNCTSAVINILYVLNESSTVYRNVHIGDKIECSANKSKDLMCDYKWKWFQGEDITTESSNSTLKPRKSGLHKCEASCNITKRPCDSIHVMIVYVNMTSEPTNKEQKDLNSSSAVKIAIPIVVVLLLIIVAVLIGIWVRHRKNDEMDVLDSRNKDDVNREPQEETIPLIGDQARGQSGLHTTYQLGGRHKLILEVNSKVFVDLIDPSKLLNCLYSASLINESQKLEITSRPTDSEKVHIVSEIVLGILIQGELEDRNKAMKCLLDTGHSNVADVLEGGEVVVRVHTQMCDYENSEKTSEIEDNLVTSLTKYTQPEMSEPQLGFDQIELILEETKSNIIAARRGGSVVLYVSLAKMRNLRNLEDELESGKLKNAIQRIYEKMIEQLSGKLNSSPVKITVTIELHNGDLDNAKGFFEKTEPTKENTSDNAVQSDFANAGEMLTETTQLVMAKEDQWEEVIRTNFNYLVEKIDAGNDLYGALKMLDIFTNIQLKRFWNHEISSKRITLMLVSLERKDFDSFKKFCAALEKSGQGHVVKDCLSTVKEPSTKPDSDIDDPDAYRPISPGRAQCLKYNYTKLIDKIRFDNELLAHLGERNTFTSMAFTHLEANPDTTIRGHMILDKLANGSEKQYKNFCEALIATKQQHIVVDLLTPPVDDTKNQSQSSGEQTSATQTLKVTNQPHIALKYSTPPTDHTKSRLQPSEQQTLATQKLYPIGEKKFGNAEETSCLRPNPQLVIVTEDNWGEVIRSNFNELVQKIEAKDDLLGALKKEDIFTTIQLKRFWSHESSPKRVTPMLQCLERKDFGSFKRFCAALENSKQSHIVGEHLSAVKKPSVKPDSAPDDLDSYRPIASDRARCLKNNYTELLNVIDFNDELLGLLGASNIFTAIMLKELEETSDPVERGSKILSKLENGSEKQYADFFEAVKATKQDFTLLTPRAVNIKSLSQPLEELTSAIQNGAQVEIFEGSSAIKAMEGISSEINGFSQCSDDFIKQRAYKCDSTPRGRAIIINNQYFTQDNLSNRDGAHKDNDNLKSLFELLDFVTIIHADQTAKQITDILTQESKEEWHKDYDMFVLFLLSHGDKGKIYGTDCQPVEIAAIISLFDGNNCPNLVQKPKIFFIQACQGNLQTTGATADSAASDGPEPKDGPISVKGIAKDVVEKLEVKEDSSTCIPLEPLPNVQCDAKADKVHEKADMAVFYATVEGYVAWRSRDHGSFFVECLTNVMTKNAHESDLMSMATEVFDMLHNCEVLPVGAAPQKQIGEKRDTLRKKVYLLPRRQTVS